MSYATNLRPFAPGSLLCGRPVFLRAVGLSSSLVSRFILRLRPPFHITSRRTYIHSCHAQPQRVANCEVAGSRGDRYKVASGILLNVSSRTVGDNNHQRRFACWFLAFALSSPFVERMRPLGLFFLPVACAAEVQERVVTTSPLVKTQLVYGRGCRPTLSCFVVSSGEGSMGLFAARGGCRRRCCFFRSRRELSGHPSLLILWLLSPRVCTCVSARSGSLPCFTCIPRVLHVRFECVLYLVAGVASGTVFVGDHSGILARPGRATVCARHSEARSHPWFGGAR